MMLKNLCFFVYPVKGSFWRFHLEQLNHYWDAFNNKKVITVAKDGRTVELDELKKALGRNDVLWREVPNHPVLWETSAFPGALEAVQSHSPNEATFYAHGKGVGHMDLAKRFWCESMYYFNLASIKLTETLLPGFDAVGAFQRKNMNHAGSNWHYIGTFFWFKHSAVFTRNWRDIEPTGFGVEGWPGRHILLERSFSLIDPPDTKEFRDKWMWPVPQLHGWTPEIAYQYFSTVRKGQEEWMRRLLQIWNIKEPAKGPIRYDDRQYVTGS